MIEYIRLFKFVPLTIFLAIGRFYGFTEQAWYMAFVVAAIASLVVNGILLMHNLILDRFGLGLNLFFLVGGLAFFFNVSSILMLYSKFKALSLFANIALVGLVTTIFSPYGFIGIQTHNKNLIKKNSWLLLSAVLAACVFSYVFNDAKLLISGALPFIFLKFFRDQLYKKTIKV